MINLYNHPYEITPEILDLVVEISDILKKFGAFIELRKVPSLKRKSMIKSIHGSLSIENNPLSLEEIASIVKQKMILNPEKEVKEVQNAYHVYSNIHKYNPYSVNDLLSAHGIMMNGIMSKAGSFRNGGVGVYDGEGNLVHLAPDYQMAITKLNELFNWLKESKLNILIKSSIFHYEFEFIHPFFDGNGRMGRLWQTLLLINDNPAYEYLPIEAIINVHRENYYKAIRESTKKASSTPFILFMLETIKETLLTEIDSFIVSKDPDNLYYIKQILEVIEEKPLSANELMKKLGLKSIKNFRKNYLNPALKLNIIKPTSKKKNSPRQKYYLK